MTGNQRLQTAIRPPLAKRVVYRVKTVHVRPGDADGLLDLGKIIRQYPHPGVLTGCRLQRLADAGDQGWLLVEAEQDPAKANPLEYAMKARKYIREHTGL